jgi:hypothetical protein
MKKIAFLSFILLMIFMSVGTSAETYTSQSFNPDISVILDGYYHYDNSDEGLGHILAEIEGFGHHHHGSDENEHHHGPDAGFNLNHLELTFSGYVDPAFKAQAGVAVETSGATEIHEAFIETMSLPGGFAVKCGKFFSDFGRTNPQHAHEYEFVEGPLANTLILGAHGLNDLGLQLSWLVPAPFYVLLGAEGFQGNNETAFPYIGGDPFSDKYNPRIGVGWVKLAPNLPDAHGLQIGSSFGLGVRQEAHDGDGDDAEDHWLDGIARFLGVDVVYKYDSPSAYGKGDITLQAEYLYRYMDVEVIEHDLNPAMVGRHKIDKQDGYYVQMIYGLIPRWRVGARWEQVGFTNETQLPSGTIENPDASNRITLMTDFSYSEFSRLRLEVSNGNYVTEEGTENVWAAMMQIQVSLGIHGAHKF